MAKDFGDKIVHEGLAASTFLKWYANQNKFKVFYLKAALILVKSYYAIFKPFKGDARWFTTKEKLQAWSKTNTPMTKQQRIDLMEYVPTLEVQKDFKRVFRSSASKNKIDEILEDCPDHKDDPNIILIPAVK